MSKAGAISRAGLALLAYGVSALPAAASFLDTDFWCRTYGCAVVYDSTSFEIYDNWQFASNSCCVPFGGQMTAFYVTTQTLRQTGSTAAIDTPEIGEGMILGIKDSVSGGLFADDGDGFLDASDELSAFTLSSATDLQLDGPGRQYSHSFWISSRNTRFSLRALAQINNASGDFANTITLGDIKLNTNVTTNGNDGGFQFGNRANSSNILIINDVDDLGDLTGASTRLIQFGRFNGIRQRNGDLNDQTVRLDFLYTMPDYDMSMGIGALDIDVIFDFYRESSATP